MRLSEKTIELNLCSQISQASKKRIIWFGLTQVQEARAGFDAATKLGGKLILFQFKASNYTVGGARRFFAPHDQLQELLRRAAHTRRSVFYVLPLIGNTQELSNVKGDLLTNTWLLDVSTLPNPFPQPTTNNKHRTIRKNGNHFLDVIPPKVIIHSDPVEASMINLRQFISEGLLKSDGTINLFEGNFDNFHSFSKIFQQNGKAAIILD